MSAPRRYRLILTLALVVGLLASLYVAVVRVHHERNARRVELVMDYPDFAALARSYGYDQRAFLRSRKRAGLTSLAVAEELGSGVSSSVRESETMTGASSPSAPGPELSSR